MTAIGTPEFFPDGGPIAIRDGTEARVKAMTGFANVFGQRVAPTKPDQLPLACIWHAGDRTEPWGDANVGAPRFMHKLSLVVDIMTKATTPDALDASIVDLVERLRATLLTDSTWVNLFEACERCDTNYSYPSEGSFIYARGVIEFELTFRSEWQPYLPNDLLEVATTITSLPGSPQIQDIEFED